MKTHQQVWEATIERYIRRELGEEEIRSFEEHLLECKECFEELQVQERFVAGVRHSARTGQLTGPAVHDRWRWLVPSLAAALAAVLLVAVAWIGTMRSSLRASVQARESLTRQLAKAHATPAPSATLVAGNLSIAVLSANRATGGESVLSVPAGAHEVALWMDVERGGRYRTFSVAVRSQAGQEVETLRGLTRNSEGAVAVVLPAVKLPPGRYSVGLSGEAPSSRLLAQYSLKIAAE